MIFNFIKKIINIIFDTVTIFVLLIRKIFLLSTSINNFSDLFFKEKLKDKYNKTLILGNGPSLKNDIDRIISLKDCSEIYVVNYFASTEYFNLLKPRYYFLSDPMFWRDNVNDAVSLDNQNLFKEINNVNWPITIICKREGYKKIKTIFNTNKFIKVIFIDSAPINFKFLKMRLFSMKRQISTPNFNNVLTFAIWYSLLNKKKEIELYGADFSQFKTFEVDQNNNKIIQIGSHFYKQTKGQKNISKKYKNRKDKMMHTKLLGTFISFNEMYVMSMLAISLGINIINYSSNSYLDCFKRPE